MLKLIVRKTIEELQSALMGWKIEPRGEYIDSILNEDSLFALKIFFKKRPDKKWTSGYSRGRIINAKDYIISIRKAIIRYIQVLYIFSTWNDHRIIRVEVRLIVRTNKPICLEKYIENRE